MIGAEGHGGVLSDGAILAYVEDGVLISRGFTKGSLQPASYDVTIAPDGFIAPDGSEIGPGWSGPRPRRIALRSGDTALFSTNELFRMPPAVAGNLTIKNRLANDGLTLLSGMLIDPEYGMRLEAPSDDEGGCRLYLHVANIGRETIFLRPGGDQIARVQFLDVRGPRSETREQVPPSRWADQRQASLGFLTDLKQLKEDVDRTSYRSQQVVLLGFVVLGISLIGVSLSTVLSLTMNTRLVHELRSVWPHSSSGKLGVAGVALGLPLCVLTLCLLFREVPRALRLHKARRPRR